MHGNQYFLKCFYSCYYEQTPLGESCTELLKSECYFLYFKKIYM